MAVLILFTSQNTNITAQLQKVLKLNCFLTTLKTKSVTISVCDHKNPEVAISRDYHGNHVGNFNILGAHSELIVETNMLVRTTHSKKYPK
jgi:hypothetical protein